MKLHIMKRFAARMLQKPYGNRTKYLYLYNINHNYREVDIQKVMEQYLLHQDTTDLLTIFLYHRQVYNVSIHLKLPKIKFN